MMYKYPHGRRSVASTGSLLGKLTQPIQVSKALSHSFQHRLDRKIPERSRWTHSSSCFQVVQTKRKTIHLGKNGVEIKCVSTRRLDLVAEAGGEGRGFTPLTDFFFLLFDTQPRFKDGRRTTWSSIYPKGFFSFCSRMNRIIGCLAVDLG